MTIQVDNISKQYANIKVIENITFSISKNDCIGIIGKNGVGKTTLLKLLLGMRIPNSGSIYYEKSKILSLDLKKRMGFYIGREYLPEELTGREYLNFLNQIYCDGARTPYQIEELFNFFFDSTDSIDKKIRDYSYGMAQKIGICGAILHEPELLILDETFNGLDIFSSTKVVDFLIEYAKKHTVITSSHDINFLEKICNKILLLEAGCMIYFGSTEQLRSNFDNSLEKSILNTLNDTVAFHNPLNWLI